jgi:hypothetical protein
MIARMLLALVSALLLGAIGYWGRRNAASLAADRRSATARTGKEESIRRGAWGCWAMAVVFLVLGVLDAVHGQ